MSSAFSLVFRLLHGHTAINLLSSYLIKRRSEIELQRKLNQPRVVARRSDAAEIAGVDDSAVCIKAATGGSESVEVADWVREVDLIEKIEELCAEFDVL